MNEKLELESKLAKVKAELAEARPAADNLEQADSSLDHVLPAVLPAALRHRKRKRYVDAVAARRKGVKLGHKFHDRKYICPTTKDRYSVCHGNSLGLCEWAVAPGCFKCPKGVHLRWDEMDEETKQDVEGHVLGLKALNDGWDKTAHQYQWED